MLASLRVRLLLTLIIAVGVAVGMVALLASRTSSSELQRYVNLDQQRNRQLLDTLISEYQDGQQQTDPASLASQIAQSFGERVIITNGDGSIQADTDSALQGQQIDCSAPVLGIVISLGKPSCIQISASEPAGYPQNDIALPAGRTATYTQLATEPASSGDILFIGMPVSNTLAVAQSADAHIGSVELSVAAPQTLPAPLMVRRISSQASDPIQAGFTRAVNRSLLLSAGIAGVVAILLTAMLSRRILKPVEALTAAAQRMEKGDLSQRVDVRANDEIGVLAQAFNAMASGLERNEQLRRHMISDVAHELRTPLTNIRGYLEALRDGVAEPSPEILASVHEEALLLNRLVDDLQDLALAEAGQLRLERQPTDIAAVIETAVGGLRPRLEQKQLDIQIELPDALPYADIDAERIGQVLRNLLNNAIIHTPEYGAIYVRAEHSAATPESIVIHISDTGCGIDPEHLPHLFERFYRADPARARSTGGAGLGLTIVKRLVEAHGGQVWVASAPGQGSTFSCALPALSYSLQPA